MKRIFCMLLTSIYMMLALCGCTATERTTASTESNIRDGGSEIPDHMDVVVTESQDISENPTESMESSEIITPSGEYDFTICFAGDINLDDDWSTVIHMNQQENGILDCIGPELVQTMQEADVMCLNNEFTFSTEGEPLAGKLYVFRAHPDRVDILHTLGVDAVSLANNHACDFGSVSLLQTMETLKEAGIAYVGAGANLE
ncbi:MAG: CapA family protein [Lachnospiraceae bacterium]|nr:CapA family protein [Lachnospiraceae bacterium]